MSSNIYEEVLFAIRKNNKDFPDYVPSANKENHAREKHEYIKSVLFSVANMSDGLWSALSTMAQNWYNESVNIIQSGKTLDFLPGLKEYPVEEPVSITPRAVTDVQNTVQKETVSVSEKEIGTNININDTVPKEIGTNININDITPAEEQKIPSSILKSSDIVKDNSGTKRKRRTKEEMQADKENLYETYANAKKWAKTISSKREATPEDKKLIRKFIFFNATSKEDVKNFLEKQDFKIHRLSLHRMYIEGMAYREVAKS